MAGSRIDQIVSMRLEGRTLQDIGNAFGVSRERIRQILKPTGVTPPAPPPKQFTLPSGTLARRMKQWLWEARFRKCAVCPIWDARVTIVSRRCPECNRENSRRWRADGRRRRQIHHPEAGSGQSKEHGAK